jgi:toxin YoeB
MNKLFAFTNRFIKDTQLLKRDDAKLLGKLWELIGDIQIQPFTGLGKPEGLKGNLSGVWSHRISDKHRLLYEVHDEQIILLSCFGHYDEK